MNQRKNFLFLFPASFLLFIAFFDALCSVLVSLLFFTTKYRERFRKLGKKNLSRRTEKIVSKYLKVSFILNVLSKEETLSRYDTDVINSFSQIKMKKENCQAN